MGTTEFAARANALFIIAILGPNVFKDWVDRVSVIRHTTLSDNINDQRNIEAVLHTAYHSGLLPNSIATQHESLQFQLLSQQVEVL
ncbi:MAG: hypothetical protein Q9180_004094 [Flavoplaca navasiana]